MAPVVLSTCKAMTQTMHCRNLYDVFRNIMDDEWEHVKTMKACRDYSIVDDLAARRLTSSGFQPASSIASSNGNNGNGNGARGVKTMDTSQLN